MGRYGTPVTAKQEALIFCWVREGSLGPGGWSSPEDPVPGGRGLRAGVLNRGTGVLCRLWVRGTGEPAVVESLLCLTLCSPMNCCTPGFPVRSLLKLMSIKSVMPSNHLILCGPLLLLPSILPSIRVFSCVSAQVIGERNGNPLQCSCLENPRDGGAWRAAIYGVTQSWTRLK